MKYYKATVALFIAAGICFLLAGVPNRDMVYSAAGVIFIGLGIYVFSHFHKVKK